MILKKARDGKEGREKLCSTDAIYNFCLAFSCVFSYNLVFPLSIIVDGDLAVRQCMVYLSGNDLSLSGLCMSVLQALVVVRTLSRVTVQPRIAYLSLASHCALAYLSLPS